MAQASLPCAHVAGAAPFDVDAELFPALIRALGRLYTTQTHSFLEDFRRIRFRIPSHRCRYVVSEHSLRIIDLASVLPAVLRRHPPR
jgi:hypothetical protein